MRARFNLSAFDHRVVRAFSQLFNVGTETTATAVGFALYRLAADPALQSRPRENPDQITVFVEEVLRLHPPLTALPRKSNEAVTVGGVELPAGTPVILCVGTVNREDHGDDISVTAQPHLTFGVGRYRCLGAHLARTELTLVVSEMLRRVPKFTLAPGFEPETIVNLAAVKLASLPLVW